MDNILEVSSLKKYFPIKKGLFKKNVAYVKAVNDISFKVKKGETLGVVGESGCGKSTLGKTIIGLLKPNEGNVKYKINGNLTKINDVTDKKIRKKINQEIQIIFQDPFSSLHPKMTVKDIISEPLDIHNIGTKENRLNKVKNLMEKVSLSSYQINRYPHEFSGGQRQRISIARALALNPNLIICDEPVSALDVSVQAQIMNLFSDLQKQFNLTYIFIAHDLSVIEYISDRVLVMYLGKIVEIGESNDIYTNPRHPYTEALLSSIPEINGEEEFSRVLL